jgi:aspartyl-tRNA(Asn)/glutamyl-tRNA(Gln) amidotransferase subunit B
MTSKARYESVIGLEVHIQLDTKSKAFCADDASYGAPPNTHISAISLAYPGTLPRPNQQQVERAIKLGLALGCEINPSSWFDRKHYFYADLPKGFQTTQDGSPICIGGEVTISNLEVGPRTIRIHHIHMEEDAGKSLHSQETDGSLLDFNRAGVPLLEMVTEPDFRSAEEVYQFINQLRQLVRYLDISDGNMEEGSLRCDCNISVRPRGQLTLNPRCEVKNVNSARYARKAVAYEIDRQTRLMEAGKTVDQETREFQPEQGITSLLRDKENAHDYRYFPEPDIPPITITKETIERIRSSMPMLPQAYFQFFQDQYGLSAYDAGIITEHRERADYCRELLSHLPATLSKQLANLFINKILPYLDEHQMAPEQFPLTTIHISDFLQLIEDGKVASSVAYQKLWPALLEAPQDVSALLQKLNLTQVSNSELIVKLARESIEENPAQVEKYLKGKKGVTKFFMGQVMRKSKGKANPELASKTITELLEQLKA